jgi:hypothetical protein
MPELRWTGLFLCLLIEIISVRQKLKIFHVDLELSYYNFRNKILLNILGKNSFSPS